MRLLPFALRATSAAVSLAFLHAGASAQEAGSAPAAAPTQVAAAGSEAEPAPLNLDTIVVTGTSLHASIMNQSVSVSTLGDEQIAKIGATSTTDLLRYVPGIHSEPTGGESNANLTARGLPISAGGSRYVQYQEDGLPVLLFGDLDFATPDTWLRTDYNVDSLQVIRGGSASTLTSNAPGGIVNFISKTGTETGGAAGISEGLNYNESRYDFDYGGHIGPKTTFHFGGFYREGRGPRNGNITAENGGQFKLNVTQNFDNGFVRLYFKELDDRTPTLLPVPVTVSGGRITALPGIDPRTAYFISPNLSRDTTLGPDGSLVTSNTRDGMHATSTAVGAEASFDLGSNISVDDKFRRASNGGRFIGLFPASVNGASMDGVLFNTSNDDLGNTMNDARLTWALPLGGENKLTSVLGLFTSLQNVAETWDWNTYRMNVVNNNNTAAFLNNGLGTFGGCCVRQFNVQYVNNSPFLALNADIGALSVDASVRHDAQRADGYALRAVANPGSGTQTNPISATWDQAGAQKVDYSVEHNSYSLGANYRLTHDLAAFARASDGVAFSGDRILYGTPLDGSAPVNVNIAKQQELGAKWRYENFSLFATAFHATTSESNFEVTTGQVTHNTYSAKGLELEVGYNHGSFAVHGGATATNAQVTAAPTDPLAVGKTPRRLAHLTYILSPDYTIGAFDFGGAIAGQTSSYIDDDNTVTMPGFVTVNAFAHYRVNEKLTLGVSANNLFNAIGYTEAQTAGPGWVGRSINGRTLVGSLKYAF